MKNSYKILNVSPQPSAEGKLAWAMPRQEKRPMKWKDSVKAITEYYQLLV